MTKTAPDKCAWWRRAVNAACSGACGVPKLGSVADLLIRDAMRDAENSQRLDAESSRRHLTRVARLASLLVREFDEVSGFSLDEWDRQKDKLFK